MKYSYRFLEPRKNINQVKEWLGKSFGFVGKRVSYTETWALDPFFGGPIEYILTIYIEDNDVEARMLIKLKLGEPYEVTRQ